jgi:hypothetical protein
MHTKVGLQLSKQCINSWLDRKRRQIRILLKQSRVIVQHGPQTARGHNVHGTTSYHARMIPELADQIHSCTKM